MFARFFLLTSLFSSVFALPLAYEQVSQRDVVDPHINSPDATTVWHVGKTETVTWSTTGLPVNQTNSVGKLVLGYLYNNSENLMLDSPLATNIDYSIGHADITVPNVPTRSDYIVVLFGDSGNASPQFTIINDASSSSSVQVPSPSSSGSPDQSPTDGSTPTSTPPPVNPSSSANAGGGGGDGGSSPLPTTGSPASGLAASPTTLSSHTASSVSTTTVVVTSSVSPSSTQSSAAWQNHVPGLGTSVGVALALIYFGFS